MNHVEYVLNPTLHTMQYPQHEYHYTIFAMDNIKHIFKVFLMPHETQKFAIISNVKRIQPSLKHKITLKDTP